MVAARTTDGAKKKPKRKMGHNWTSPVRSYQGRFKNWEELHWKSRAKFLTAFRGGGGSIFTRELLTATGVRFLDDGTGFAVGADYISQANLRKRSAPVRALRECIRSAPEVRAIKTKRPATA